MVAFSRASLAACGLFAWQAFISDAVRLRDGPADEGTFCPDLSKTYSTVAVRRGQGKQNSKTAGEVNITADVMDWFRSACPWEESRHSGAYLGNALSAKAREYASGFMCSPGSSQKRLTAEEVLLRLRGTRVTFLGDSLLRQFSQAVMCHFREHVVAEHFAWGQWPSHVAEQCLDAPGSQPLRHCKMSRGCATFKHDVQICYQLFGACGARAFESFEFDQQAERQVVVFGSGHRDHCTSEDWQALRALNPKLPPNTRVLFTEWSSMHFQNVKGTGEFIGSTSKPCVKSFSKPSEIRQAEYTSAEPILRYLNWTTLSTYKYEAELGDLHSTGLGNGYDCTHWLMPGVPDTWAKVLYQKLIIGK